MNSRRKVIVSLLLLALAIRIPFLIALKEGYFAGGISTALGLTARNLLAGRGLAETTGPPELIQLYDLQQAEGRLRDIAGFPDPPDQPTRPLIQRMPGYPLLLAAFWKLTGEYRYRPVQILQIFLSALIPLLLYGASRRLFGETAGRVAGVLAALNLAEVRLAVLPLYDWWAIFVAALLLYYLPRSRERGYPAIDFALMGVILAAGVYLKSTILAVPILLAFAMLLTMPPGRALARGAILMGLPLLALIPWAARNQRVFHRPILTNTFFWPTVWEGFGEVPNPFGAALDDRLTYYQALSGDPRLVYGTPEYDDYFRPKVLSGFEAQPGFVLSLWARRLVKALFFPGHSYGIAGTEDPERSLARFQSRGDGDTLAYLRAYPTTAAVKLAQRLWDAALALLTLLTLVVDRRRWREFLPLLAVAVAFIAAIVPLHYEARYVAPAGLVWILFASAPLGEWIRTARRPSAGRLGEEPAC